MFQRIGAAAIKKDLTNTLAFCQHLGNPHNKLTCIHIAGTNGKGSVSHMLAAVFQLHGFKTGLYTSPHLTDFRERIKINGQWIPKNDVVNFVSGNKDFIDSLQPSFFETTVAMAFDYFHRQNTDICIIETGLGGRLDSTNVIKPELCIITNIGWDHMDLLGDTLPAIAFEKAGIIKEKVPVLIGEYQEEVADVFEAKAEACHAPLHFALDFEMPSLHSDLQGNYQQKNLQIVWAACQLIHHKFRLKQETIIAALAQVQFLTGFTGRWQKLNDSPLIICDTGHNQNGIELAMEQLRQQTFNHLHMIWGMVKDKDASKIFPLLPLNARYYFTQPSVPRAKPSDLLKHEAEAFGLKGEAYATVTEAYLQAFENARPDDMIFIGGSTFVVADLLTFLNPPDEH